MEGRPGAPTRDATRVPETSSPALPVAPPPPDGPALLEGFEEGVVVCDRAGVVRAANPAARTLLPGLRVGEVVDVARCDVLARAVRDGVPEGFDAVVDHPGGERHVRGRRGPGLATSPPPPEPLDGDTTWYLRDVTGEHARTDTLLAAQERAAFLAEAGRALHGVLHLDRTARRVVALAVPRLAARATLVVRHDDTVTWACAELGGGRPRLGRRGVTHLARVPALAAALAGDEGAGPWLADELATLTGVDAHPGAVRACPVPITGVVDAVVVLADPRSTASSSTETDGTDDDPLAAAEEDLLTSYVARAGTALAAAALHEEQAHLGAVLQESLAAPRLPETPGVVWGAAYRPARETMRVGGDFYEVVRGSERSAFLLGDVCGKGIEAAVLSGRVRQSWHALRLLEDRPGRLLPLLNTALLDAVATRDESPRFATMVLGDARPLGDGSVELRLATGGHPPPLILRTNGDVEPVAMSGMLVGGVREARFGEAEVVLGPGDTCLLYSDGVVEARGPGDFFGEERLAAVLPRCAGAPAAVLCEQLEQTVVSWLDGHDHDDVALLAIQAPGSEA